MPLWDDLTAGCDGLEGRVAVGTQGDPVAAFGTSRGAFASGQARALAACRPAHLGFDETWSITENSSIHAKKK